MIEITARVVLDKKALETKIHERFDATGLALEIGKTANTYIPKKTGALENSMRVESTGKNSAQIIWNPRDIKTGEEYAKKVYWLPQSSINRKINPLASSMWFHFAKAAHFKEWLKWL